MKKVKVQIKDKTTLVLLEDAQKGDEIDLLDIQNVDLESIERVIEEGKDRVYNEKLSSMKEQFDKNKEVELKLAANEAEKDQINKSKAEIEGLKASIAELKTSIEREKMKNENDVRHKENELQARINDLEKKYNEEIANLNKTIGEKDNEYQKLLNQKTIKNIKQTGESLEQWCDGVIKDLMQNGLENCTWKKDNDVIKDEGENSGSKADFIFKVYADPSHNEDTLLTSLCLDMKDENPESKDKQKNEKYYKKLDDNRRKKNCNVAVLVSNLEADNPGIPPILKINDYSEMYMVRPAYLTTFINLIVSLHGKFKELTLKKARSEHNFHSSVELRNEFEKLKKTYLDKPLSLLDGKVKEIAGASESIIKGAEKIKTACETITQSYINSIADKIERFNIEKISRKLDEITTDEDRIKV